MTDDELLREMRRVYYTAVHDSYDAAILAVYNRGLRDGARAQREMEPTEAMLAAGTKHDTEDENSDVGADVGGIFVAMQKVAPLATEKENG